MITAIKETTLPVYLNNLNRCKETGFVLDTIRDQSISLIVPAVNVSFQSMRFVNCEFHGLTLDRCVLSSVTFERCTFQLCNFRVCEMHDVRFLCCDATGLDMSCTWTGTNRAVQTEFSKPFTSRSLIVPEGQIVGWKKASSRKDVCGYDRIVKLRIPAAAKRSNAFGRKCRADVAEVLDIQDMSGQSLRGQTVYSLHDAGFTYEIGKVVKPTLDFDTNRWDECSSGIHFFLTREEAELYAS